MPNSIQGPRRPNTNYNSLLLRSKIHPWFSTTTKHTITTKYYTKTWEPQDQVLQNIRKTQGASLDQQLTKCNHVTNHSSIINTTPDTPFDMLKYNPIIQVLIAKNPIIALLPKTVHGGIHRRLL